MDYPDLKEWFRVLCSLKLVIMGGFLIWDYFVLGGLLPYVAVYISSYIATWLPNIMQPFIEIISAVVVLFILVFVAIRIFVESFFWKKLFLMEKSYYCILAARDLLNCVGIVINLRILVDAVYQLAGGRVGLKQFNLGEGTSYIMMSRLSGYFPIDEAYVLSYLPHRDIMCTTITCQTNQETIYSAEFAVAMALLASSVAKLIYMNSLYSYMSAVELFSELDPFLPMQLSSDAYNANIGSRFSPAPRNSENNNTGNSNPSQGNSSQNVNQGLPANKLGWPLSFFREDMAVGFSG